MIFSRNLRSIPAHLVVGVLCLYSFGQIDPALRADSSIWPALVLLGALYILNVTVGWQVVQRREQPSLVYAYFCLQGLLVASIMLIEARTSGNVPSSSTLMLPLLVQVCVFSVSQRIVALLIFLMLVFAISIFGTGDPSVVTPYLITFPIGYLLIVLIGSFIVGADHVRQQNRQLTVYAVQAEELATLRERNRLARDIHDTLGHYLTTLNMQLEAASALLETDPAQARQFLCKAQTLTRDSMTEIRRSIHALRTGPIEDRLLHEAIALLIEEHREAGHPIDFSVRGKIRPGSAAAEMTLYRIVQEGLTNIRKHAQATHTDLLLDYQPEQTVRLVLHDDGVGGSPTVQKNSLGLVGVRERAELLGGHITITTGHKQGFTLQVELPL